MNTLSPHSSSFINHGGCCCCCCFTLRALQACTYMYTASGKLNLTPWITFPACNEFNLSTQGKRSTENHLLRQRTYLTNNTNHPLVLDGGFVSSLPLPLRLTDSANATVCMCNATIQLFFCTDCALWFSSFVVVPCTTYVNCAPRKIASATISL